MIVLDTHTLIWAVQDNVRLGRRAKALIDGHAPTQGNLIPAISAWEVALVEARGTVIFPGGALRWLRSVLSTAAFKLVPLEPEIACATVTMAWKHKDPADRMIVATALHWDLPLLTADEKILAYAAAGHLKAVDARL